MNTKNQEIIAINRRELDKQAAKQAQQSGAEIMVKASFKEKNKDVGIGSYPFFRAGKVGVSIVLRSEEESKISICNEQILKFVNQKKIELIKQD